MVFCAGRGTDKGVGAITDGVAVFPATTVDLEGALIIFSVVVLAADFSGTVFTTGLVVFVMALLFSAATLTAALAGTAFCSVPMIGFFLATGSAVFSTAFGAVFIFTSGLTTALAGVLDFFAFAVTVCLL